MKCVHTAFCVLTLASLAQVAFAAPVVDGKFDVGDVRATTTDSAAQSGLNFWLNQDSVSSDVALAVLLWRTDAGQLVVGTSPPAAEGESAACQQATLVFQPQPDRAPATLTITDARLLRAQSDRAASTRQAATATRGNRRSLTQTINWTGRGPLARIHPDRLRAEWDSETAPLRIARANYGHVDPLLTSWILDSADKFGDANALFVDTSANIAAPYATAMSLLEIAPGNAPIFGAEDDGVPVIGGDALNPVPEPGSLALFGLGVLGYCARSRRRRRGA